MTLEGNQNLTTFTKRYSIGAEGPSLFDHTLPFLVNISAYIQSKSFGELRQL